MYTPHSVHSTTLSPSGVYVGVAGLVSGAQEHALGLGEPLRSRGSQLPKRTQRFALLAYTPQRSLLQLLGHRRSTRRSTLPCGFSRSGVVVKRIYSAGARARVSLTLFECAQNAVMWSESFGDWRDIILAPDLATPVIIGPPAATSVRARSGAVQSSVVAASNWTPLWGGCAAAGSARAAAALESLARSPLLQAGAWVCACACVCDSGCLKTSVTMQVAWPLPRRPQASSGTSQTRGPRCSTCSWRACRRQATGANTRHSHHKV